MLAHTPSHTRDARLYASTHARACARARMAVAHAENRAKILADAQRRVSEKRAKAADREELKRLELKKLEDMAAAAWN